MKNRCCRILSVVPLLLLAIALSGCSWDDDNNPPPPAPVTPGTPQVVAYDGDPEPANARGGVNATYEYLAYFNTTKLLPYVGQRLVGVRINYPDAFGNPATHLFTVKVYGDNTSTHPGPELFSQDNTFVYDWNDVMLTTPVTITGTTEIWAGYQTSIAGVWPISHDNGSLLPNVYFFRDVAFPTYTRLESVGETHNLNIRLLVEP